MNPLYEVGRRLPDSVAQLGARAYVAAATRLGRNTFTYEYGEHAFVFRYVDVPTFTMLHDAIEEEETEDGIPLDLLQLEGHDAAIDIGAHFGVHTVVLGVKNPSLPVYAFEPNRYNRRRLQENVAANRLDDRVHVRPELVSDDTGIVTFYEDPDYTGSTRDTLKPDDGDHWEAVERQSISVSEFLSDADIERPFLKIDAEGAELAILRDLLTSSVDLDRTAGVVEVHSERLEGGEDALLALLEENGFVCECINPEPTHRKIYRFERATGVSL